MMFSTPDFWVFIAFFLFVGVFGKKGFSYLKQMVNSYHDKIVRQLDEAQHLHDEALSLLNSYKKKHEEALTHAEDIIATAKAEALEFKKTSMAEIDHLLIQKEKALLDRIAIEREEAKTKLKHQIIEEAIKIVEITLSKEKGIQKELTKNAVKKMSQLKIDPPSMQKKTP